MRVRVSADDVIAFRLHAHNLTKRLAEDGLLEAVGRCAVQDSPPGSALLALHARVRGLTPGRLAAAAADDRTLLQSWCMRGAPFCFPTSDAAVFTTGVLPPTDEAMRHFLPGLQPALERLGMTLTEAVERTAAQVRDVLSGRQLAINELGAQVAERVAETLPAAQRAAWAESGPYAAQQPLGEGVVHFCIRILTLQRVVCFAPRVGNKAPFVLTDEWLGHPIPAADPGLARAELLRRYLHCYGPSTPRDFAAWVGIAAGDTDPWWRRIEDELTPVAFGGETWVLTEDLDRLRAAPRPEGARLLPPHDPYTALRDRATVVDKAHHRDIWKAVGDPGVVLACGSVVGTWRARRSGRTLAITVTTFGSLAQRDRRALEEEAEGVAMVRGAGSATVAYVPR